MKPHRHLRWLHKDKLSAGIVVLTLLLVVALGASLAQDFLRPRTTLHLGDGVFRAMVADTDAARQKGLADTDALAINEAMLLVFDRDAQWSIWMRDVEYPIDVVWLDSQKHVVYIVKNMPPHSYPTSFTPDKPARYVVELAAGSVDAKSISIGGVARFDLPRKEGQAK